MTRLGGFGIPGTGAIERTSHKELLWGGDDRRIMALWKSEVISGATRDAANTPTTVLRPGLILGRLTSSGELEEWDGDASDGTQYIAGILDTELKATDFDANNADRSFRILVRGPVRAGALTIEGTALVGHTDEYLARRALVQAGFVFDDDPFGLKAGFGERYLTTSGAVTVTADQNGTTFVASGADTNFTLPAAKPGLSFDFIMATDHELVVTSPTADNIVVGNDASADSVTFTTAGQQIGARMRLKSVYVGTTIKWLCETVLPPFGTGTTGAFAYAIGT